MALTAKQIIQKYWDDGSLPVNPTAIANKMGIAVLADPHLDGSGHFIPIDTLTGRPLIVYNPTEHRVRQRFTIAHELGHYVLNHGERNRDKPEQFSMSFGDPVETDANTFAARLLMPATFVHALVQIRGITGVPTLARMFDVSQAAMRYRLKELHYAVG